MGAIGRRIASSFGASLLARASSGLKPQDVLVALKLVVSPGREWRLSDLAQELGLSQTEVSFALERARLSHFVDPSKRKPFKSALEEYLLHGIRYSFPVLPGPVCGGIPTSHSMTPLSSTIVSAESDQYVWPDVEGTMRGQAIMPLYPSVPFAARRDQKLYELLALVDALRVGRARERALAKDEIHRRLHEAH